MKVNIKTRRKAIMTNWTINAINTINHNDVEYIYVPFNYALFRDKSN